MEGDQLDEDWWLSQLTQADWLEIKRIAIQIHDSGEFQADQMKCSVAAFLRWFALEQEWRIRKEESAGRFVH